MAYIQDATHSFTLNFRLLARAGIIVWIKLITPDGVAEWDPSGPPPIFPTAIAGKEVNVMVTTQNQGEILDRIFVSMENSEVVPIPSLAETDLEPNGGFVHTFGFIMPAANINIQIDAGHVE